MANRWKPNLRIFVLTLKIILQLKLHYFCSAFITLNGLFRTDVPLKTIHSLTRRQVHVFQHLNIPWLTRSSDVGLACSFFENLTSLLRRPVI